MLYKGRRKTSRGQTERMCDGIYEISLLAEVTVLKRSVSDRFNTVDVVWYHNRNMDVCSRFFFFC